MDKKTEALKLAKRAIEAHNNGDWGTAAELFGEALPAIREALAEQPTVKQSLTVEQPEHKKEKPMHPEIRKMWADYFDKCFAAFYTSPPASKPLTDEQIDKLDCVYALWDDGECCTIMGIKDFARAIEAAHGIKEGA